MMDEEPTNSNTFLTKLAALHELEAALKYKKGYEDLFHEFLGLYKEFLNYCERNKIAIPQPETYERIMSHVRDEILSKPTLTTKSPNENNRKDDQTGTEQSRIFDSST